jgi:3-hydroxymyristoyl/3-hydroxydecanoyl-(acyl carrier protein) dehydratase
MRAAPFVARWSLSPQSSGAFDGEMILDDPAAFAGHYPGAPIFPGTFLIEALFQAVGTVLADDVRIEQIVACRFRSPLLPGDALSAHFMAKDAGAGRTLVEVTAQGRAPAAELIMLFASLAATRSDDVAPASARDQEARAGEVRALDAAFIERVLPHRAPALLVERAVVLGQPGTKSELRGYKTVTPGEPCFVGGGLPATGRYPQSLVVESFCQSCGLLRAATAAAAEPRSETKVPVVAKLANLRFFADARVGDQLEHLVRLTTRTPDGAVFSGQTAASGRLIMQVDRVVAATAAIAQSR